MIHQSKEKAEHFANLYECKAYSYNEFIDNLCRIKKISYMKPYQKIIDDKIAEIKVYNYYLNDLQKLKDKKTYLITLTDTLDMNLVSNFIKKLSELKRGKKFNGIEFDYYATLEFTKKGLPHIHIKLVIDDIRGIRKKIDELISKIKYTKLKNIKKQGVDRNNYLTKQITSDNKKEYIGCLLHNNLTLAKATRASRFIKICDELKITIKEFRFLYRHLCQDKNRDKKSINFYTIKDYLLGILSAYLNAHTKIKVLKEIQFQKDLKKLLKNKSLNESELTKEVQKLKRCRTIYFKEVFNVIQEKSQENECSSHKEIESNIKQTSLKQTLTFKSKIIRAKIKPRLWVLLSQRNLQGMSKNTLTFPQSLHRYINQVSIVELIIYCTEARARGPSLILKYTKI